MAIGKKNTGTSAGDYWYGQLDEVRVYNRGLVPSEITTIMHAGDIPLTTPTGLTAYPGNTRASLVWSASSAASSYNVKRSTVSGGPYATIGNALTPGYTDNGLANGTTYYYVVSAVNVTNETANSSQVSALPALGVSFFANANYGGGSYVNCLDASQPGVPAVLSYLGALDHKIKPNCAAGHYYLLNNYNPGYFGDGTNAFADTNAHNTVYTIPSSSVRNIGDALN